MYGWRGKHPIPPSNFSEFAGGSLICFSGILLALLERNKTGKGQVIDSNIVEGLSYLGSWLIKSQKMLFANTRGTNMYFNNFYLTSNIIIFSNKQAIFLDWTAVLIFTIRTKRKMENLWLWEQ